MKKTFFVLFSIACSIAAFSQQQDIKQGNTLEYAVYPNGMFLTGNLFMEKINADTVTIAWTIQDRSGRRTMLKNSIDNGKGGYWNPPIDGEDIIIPEDELLLCVSKTAFQSLKQTGKMVFDGVLFTAEINKRTYKVGNKLLNAIHLTNDKTTTNMWVLDDPDLPLILKLEGNPFNVDVELTGIM